MTSSSERQSELDSLRMLDPQAIGAIYDRYFQDVYRFTLYRLNDEKRAEDIASDVFLRLLEAVKKKRGPKKNIKAWLLSTAAHIITDHHRRHYRRPTAEMPKDLVDQSVSPSQEFERSHQNHLAREALQHLTSEQQTVLTLRFGQGYSLEETAKMMKKKSNAIKALQFRALAALRRQVGEVA
ncbi:MAG: sigma-70 family RNA polymerase sigma factor [Anaerolineae bacterium]|jgi:RNA polymerase sigma-70 factor, ECF subfamily|nr:sigma-70 family RNA polymerase sigma factor [Anaerolineae bacterium]MBT7074675.1 sigma-70 family RNA polymerase sigma factor [Anaerolineae bacterium]MBT7782371.1 sigma-70 family RNA polymerase sigma factor [Anaerolineae bacterium]